MILILWFWWHLSTQFSVHFTADCIYLLNTYSQRIKRRNSLIGEPLILLDTVTVISVDALKGIEYRYPALSYSQKALNKMSFPTLKLLRVK